MGTLALHAEANWNFIGEAEGLSGVKFNSRSMLNLLLGLSTSGGFVPGSRRRFEYAYCERGADSVSAQYTDLYINIQFSALVDKHIAMVQSTQFDLT